MKGYVKVTFVGTIEGEVKRRQTDDGTPVVNFTVVADVESHTTGRGTQERVNVAAFGKMATDNEFKPGARVHGEGRQQTRKGRDRPDVVMSLFVPLDGGG